MATVSAARPDPETERAGRLECNIGTDGEESTGFMYAHTGEIKLIS
jgi:hypothetical protein